MKALIILADGFEEIEAITPIDTLRRAGMEVIVAGVGSKTVVGAHQISIQTDIQLNDYRESVDIVVLPGGLPGASNLAADSKVNEVIQRQLKENGWIAAICASPALVLEPAGILRGKTATCYPGFEKQFGASVSFSKERVVVDGRVITSRGPGTALEFSLVIVENLVGSQKASELRLGMLAIAGD